MSEDKLPSHHPENLSRHDEYTEAKERLTKLAEQFHFELTEFRQMWTNEPDVENATRQVVR
jgi:tetrahydromethanopterin S-methyltransferase subunit G